MFFVFGKWKMENGKLCVKPIKNYGQTISFTKATYPYFLCIREKLN